MARHHQHGHWQKDWSEQRHERDPAKICSTTGKRIYASEEEARATADHQTKIEAQSDPGKNPVRLRVYRCLYCDGWHLTSKES